MKKNKLTFTQKELSEIRKTSVDAPSNEQGVSVPSQSTEVFSIAEEFGLNRDEAMKKMAFYIYTLLGTSQNHDELLRRAIEIGPTISYIFNDLSEIVSIYNQIVINKKSPEYLLQATGEIQPVSTTLPLSELMSQTFPKSRYTLEPFFEQGTVNMISAPPNSWKSWLMFLCAISISDGTELFTKFPTEKTKVLIVNEEDSFRSIQDRFRILDVTNPNLPIFFRVANGSKLESKFITTLLEELKEKEIGVVIFDSLRSMHEADENDSTAMQKILDQMKRISREGITVIFTHHHRKKGLFEKGSTAESSRGSSAINAAISGHISLDEEERETGLYLVIRHLKSKAGEKLSPFEIKIIKENNQVKFIYDGEFKAAEKKLKQTKDQIRDVLSDGKWKCKKDFEESIVVGKNIMIQALQSLKTSGIILSIDRKTAIAKSIPVTEKGKSNELYYCLNTETSEYITREEEEITTDSFDDY